MFERFSQDFVVHYGKSGKMVTILDRELVWLPGSVIFKVKKPSHFVSMILRPWQAMAEPWLYTIISIRLYFIQYHWIELRSIFQSSWLIFRHILSSLTDDVKSPHYDDKLSEDEDNTKNEFEDLEGKLT